MTAEERAEQIMREAFDWDTGERIWELRQLRDAITAVTREAEALLRRTARLVYRHVIRPIDDPVAFYDEAAAAFWRETGRMAPGKSRPMEMGEDPDPLGTEKLWIQWRMRQYSAAVDEIRAALALVGVGKDNV